MSKAIEKRTSTPVKKSHLAPDAALFKAIADFHKACETRDRCEVRFHKAKAVAEKRMEKTGLKYPQDQDDGRVFAAFLGYSVSHIKGATSKKKVRALLLKMFKHRDQIKAADARARRQWIAAERRINRDTGEDAAYAAWNRAGTARSAAVDRVMGLRARTAQGIKAKLDILIKIATTHPDEWPIRRLDQWRAGIDADIEKVAR